jgi:hypothetical protein
MAERPDSAKLAKLPVWAQEYIRDLQRQRDIAVRELNEWRDQQTPSPFYIDEMVSTGEQQGPSIKRRYIQAHRITCESSGVALDIFAAVSVFENQRNIQLRWQGTEPIGLFPQASNCLFFVAKRHMN